MKNRLTRRQTVAWCFCASTVPAVMTCAGLPWQWVLAGCAASAAFLWLVCAAMRQAANENGLCGVVQTAFGKYGGKIVLVMSAIWTLFAASDTAAACARAFSDDMPSQLAPPVLLLLAAWSGAKGKECAGRCAAVLAPLLAGLYALIALCAVKDVNPIWCRPWGNWRASAQAAGPMLLSVAGLYLYNNSSGEGKDERGGRLRTAALIALAVAPAMLAAVTAGTLSPQLTREETFAFYTLTKNMRFLSVMERFEPILSASLVAGYFCILTLLVQSAAAQLAAAEKKVSEKRAAPLLCAAAYTGTFAVEYAPEPIRQIGAAVFWGILPSLALLIVAIKKV